MNDSIKIWIITLFPEYFSPMTQCGVTASALRGERGTSFQLNIINLRDFSEKKYKNVDDPSIGGGPGMVIRADLLKNALEGILTSGAYADLTQLHIVYASPRGKKWTNLLARKYADEMFIQKKKDLVFICGRYEGIDERFLDLYVNEEISLGDFVLSGGELPVMAILDSMLRFLPGTLANDASVDRESFEDDLLDHPHYTKPLNFEGQEVPPILLSGHHKNIEDYRQNERIRITKKYRPDLLEKKK